MRGGGDVEESYGGVGDRDAAAAGVRPSAASLGHAFACVLTYCRARCWNEAVDRVV